MPYTVLDRSTAAAAQATTLGDPLTADNGLSFQELVDELDAQLLSRTDISATRHLLFINQAYADICSSLKLDEMRASISIPVVDTQPLYLLPSAIYSIEQMSILEPVAVSSSEGRPLEMIDLGAYRSRPDEDSQVREWFRHTGMLVVWPTPNYAGATFGLDFRIRPTAASGALGAIWPILPYEWHETIVLLAKQKALVAVRDYTMAQITQNEFVNMVRRRLDPSALDEDKRPMRSSVPRHTSQLRKKRKDISPRGF